MGSGYMHISGKKKLATGDCPSLVDLCIQTAIDNIRYIGNVGETDTHLLERILPHCTVEQLMHIENATVDRDLSPVTNNLWKKFYEAKFGIEAKNKVIERMTQRKVTFPWRLLYQAKLDEQDKRQQASLERLSKSFREAAARKQSRQIQLVQKAPPGSKKRSFCGGSGFGAASSVSNVRSNLMKKAKVEFLNSTEMKNRVAMKKTTLVRHQSACTNTKSPGLNKRDSASTSKFIR